MSSFYNNISATAEKLIAKYGDSIILQGREIVAPQGEEVDYTLTFADQDTVLAVISTSRGETVFDSTNTERDVTHRFVIMYVSGVTSETWIEYNGSKFDILDVENISEQNKILILRAAKRGPKTSDINLT